MLKFLMLLIFSITFTAHSKEAVRPLLWKIEKQGKVAYALGTFHLGVKLDDFPVKVKQLIKSSKSVIFEVDLANIDYDQYNRLAMYPEGQSLDQYLSKTTLSELAQLLGPIVGADGITKFRPFFYISLLTNMTVSGADQGSLDVEIHKLAEKNKIEVQFLESAISQLSVLSAIYPESEFSSQIKEAGSVSKLVDTMKNQNANLKGCYVKADLKCFVDSFKNKQEGGLMSEWQRELLLSQRNRTWVLPVMQAMDKGQAFIAVGAGHLVGKDSLLELLKAQGYSVKQIKM